MCACVFVGSLGAQVFVVATLTAVCFIFGFCQLLWWNWQIICWINRFRAHTNTHTRTHSHWHAHIQHVPERYTVVPDLMCDWNTKPNFVVRSRIGPASLDATTTKWEKWTQTHTHTLHLYTVYIQNKPSIFRNRFLWTRVVINDNTLKPKMNGFLAKMTDFFFCRRGDFQNNLRFILVTHYISTFLSLYLSSVLYFRWLRSSVIFVVLIPHFWSILF